jgi:indole-3-acetate monooxygenase
MSPQLQHALAALKGHFNQASSKMDSTVVELLFRERLFKCFLPTELNGLGLSLTETMQVIRECAYINGSLGWLVQIGNGGNYFASCFPEPISKELFSPLSAVIAGSGAPSGSAVKTGDGYILSGNWRYCSGADYASLFTVTFICPENGAKLAAILPKNQIHVIPDWETSGLPYTSTHTIHLEQVHVASRFIFDVGKQVSFQNETAFQMPFVIYAQAFFLQVGIGLSSRFCEEARTSINKKHQHWSIIFPSRLESALSKLDLLESQNLQLIRRIEEMTAFFGNGSETLSAEENYRTELIFLTKKIRELIHEIFWDLGIEVVYKNHPIHQVYQDFLVCTQHYLLREN